MNAVLEVREPSARYLDAVGPPLVRRFDLLADAPGGVARLRELIFALAVRGKLVPQNTGEKPASVLLQRIREEKAATVPKGKERASAATSAEAQWEEPFELPWGWAWTTLSEIGLINPRNAADEAIEASFVQMSSIPVAYTESHASEPRPWGDIKSGFTQFAEGDVGVAKITPCFENGKSTAFTSLRNGIGAGTTELHIVRPLGGIAPRYILAFLKSPGFLRGGEAVMTGTAGQKRLPRAYFEACPFPLPPLSEQTRIVARVDELMRLCDALEAKGRLEAEQHARLLGTLLGTLTNSSTPEELAANWQRVADHFDLLLDRPEAVDALEQTILQLAVRGMLVPQDPSDEPAKAFLDRLCVERRHRFSPQRSELAGLCLSSVEEPYELPAGWLWTTIEHLAVVGTGTTPSRDTAAYFSDGTIPWVTSGETGQPFIRATSQHVTEAALASTSLNLYPIGTLIVAMYGQGKTRGQVSELCIEATTNQACAAIVLMERSASHRGFVKLVFEKSYDEIRELSAGGAQPNLNLGKVKASLVPLPPLAEQARIVARVTELRRLCADLRQRLTASQATQSHLADAMVEQAAA